MGYTLIQRSTVPKGNEMSFSYTITGKDKTEAYDKSNAEVDLVVQSQPAHTKDGWLVKQTVRAYLDLLPDDANHHISVSVHGSVGWVYDGTDGSDSALSSVSVGVSVWHVPAKAHAADELDTSV